MDRKKLAAELSQVVGVESVFQEPEDLAAYQYDAYLSRAMPDLVVFPTTTEQVSEVLKIASREKAPFVARGAGTGISGGAIPVKGGIVIALSRMNKILEVDFENRRARVQPGVINLDLSNHMKDKGFHYIPDPASQQSCTIGGNIGENAGGPHCLAYGVTTNHVLGLTVVLPNGDIIHTGGKALDHPGYDLTGLLVGSEGTLGIVTEAVVRIERRSEAVKTLLTSFSSMLDAARVVSAIIASGTIPAALEMMDKPAIEAVEAFAHAGYPVEAAAVLLIELEGLRDGMDRLTKKIVEICQSFKALEVKVAQNEQERMQLWKGRKCAAGAIGRICNKYYLHDCVVPRNKLVAVLSEIYQIAERYGVQVANVFHAGDGNLHPLVPMDMTNREQMERALQAGDEILKCCIAAGGTLSGEHGIGLEKNELMPLIFSEDDLQAMKKIKSVFNPDDLCNPGKVFPTPGRCLEVIQQHGS
jgi:glycolate oxidase